MKIRNTYIPNAIGDGHEKEIILDNGDTYRIRNTYIPNAIGDGYEQEIVKVNKSDNSTVSSLIFNLMKVIGCLILLYFLPSIGMKVADLIIRLIF